MDALTQKNYDNMATALRMLSVDMVENANSGHPGMPLGMADVATVLFGSFLTFDPNNPQWINRDRLVLSAGHGSALLYAALHLSGYDLSIEDLKQFRKLHSKTPGHPEYGHTPGVESTTGPLGQGLGNAVGMALAEAILNERFGSKTINHYTYVIASDGDLMEGISHEAASLAGHLGLKKLIVLWDDNGITIDGPLNLSSSENVLKRFESYDWNTLHIDGHNKTEIFQAISKAQKNDKPTIIACKTKIGFGAPTKEGTSAAHGAPLGSKELEQLKSFLNWTHSPFNIPSEIKTLWEETSNKGRVACKQWFEDLNIRAPDVLRCLQKSPNLPFDHVPTPLMPHIKEKILSLGSKATRQFSQEILNLFFNSVDKTTYEPFCIGYLIGGSADLTPSNNTFSNHQQVIKKNHYSGHYIHYGIREHAMAACMNGLSLHGPFRAYGGTFLTFSDYMRPSIRLSALMKLPVIYVMTHDSIGLGEDGPTHQPIEHLMSLRTIPNLNVFRPADGIETAECWELALNSTHTPSLIVLSRQSVTPFRKDFDETNQCAKGAYEICQGNSSYNRKDLQVTLIGTGSEVGLALSVQQLLNTKNVNSHVISMPCWGLFDSQENSYKESILPAHTLKVSIEAGSSLGWERYVGNNGLIIGMHDFGASGEGESLFEHFGFTAAQICEQILDKLKNSF